MSGEISVSQRLIYMDLQLDPRRRQAICDQRAVAVKAKAFSLLVCLMLNAGTVVSKEDLYRKVWGYTFAPGTKVLEVQLTYLRKILFDLGCCVEIKTLRGIGLLLR